MSPSLLDNGIYPNVARDRYDTIERVNFSSLKWMAKSAAHYRHYKLNKTPDTDAKVLGRAVHIAVFEPETFEQRVVRWDGGTRRGKDWDAFCEEHEGKELLTEAAWDKCIAIQAAVRAEPAAQRYLQGGRGELTGLWNAQSLESGDEIPAKVRWDFDGEVALADLKTTFDSEPNAFGKQVCNLLYDARAAWDTDAYFAVTGRRKPYKFIAIESEPPYVVTVCNVTQRSIDLGREAYQRWLDQLAWCRKHSRWPGYTGGAEVDLPIPTWRDAESFEDDEVLTKGGKPL